jgi:hypothetical protein
MTIELEPICCGSGAGHHSGCECGEVMGYWVEPEDKATIEALSERIAAQDAMLKQCARGFEKHARHWRESASRTKLIEDSLRAENAEALAAEASSLTQEPQ